MKKKSRNSCERRRKVTTLVRGPLKTKEKGELAELAFLHKAASLGFGVAQPHERYDFILDSGERFWRVQVKSTSYTEPDRSAYVVNACHNDKGRKVKAYQASEVDFIAVYIVPIDTWYIIPVNQLGALRSLRLYPSGCQGAARFERFREAWHLMAPGADLPHPRKPRQVRTPDVHHKQFIKIANSRQCETGKGPTSPAAEKPSIRIRVCLQAYRKSLKLNSALAAGFDVCPADKRFSADSSVVPSVGKYA